MYAFQNEKEKVGDYPMRQAIHSSEGGQPPFAVQIGQPAIPRQCCSQQGGDGSVHVVGPPLFPHGSSASISGDATSCKRVGTQQGYFDHVN